eukprot:g34050.t1
MSTFFLNRGFRSTVVNRALDQLQPIFRSSTLTPSLPSRDSDKVPLILTYHPTSIHIQKTIRCHFCHLQGDATTRYIFPSLPLSAFRRDRSLWDTLVHTSFIPNKPPQPYGIFPCNQQSVVSSTLGKRSIDWVIASQNIYVLLAKKTLNYHFNAPPCCLANISVSGLLQCSSKAQRKLE